MNVETKKCYRCSSVKQIDSFPISKGIVNSWCRECHRIRSKEKRGPRTFKKTEINGNNKKCAYCSEWKNFKEYYKAKLGKGGISSYCKPCHKIKYPHNRYVTPEKSVRYGIKRRKAKKIGFVSDQYISLLYSFPLCFYCGEYTKRAKREIDHIVPIYLDGEHTPVNLIMACKTCNSAKRIKPLKEFLL